MIKAPPTPKGFRDILPELAKKRRDTINKIIGVLEEFGFVPVETPTIEFAETLKGKYGEEEKLIYEFQDRGGRNLALRYDLTVPLARFVASNLKLIEQGPFRRYQIGQVFRGEKPQKGRFREFTQFDFDVVNSPSLQEDANVIAAAIKSVRALGLENAKMSINDRFVFKNLKPEFVRAVDKLQKIGKDGVVAEMMKSGADEAWARRYISTFDKSKPTPIINTLFKHLKELDLKEGKDFELDPTLARGLDYYTATIFELKLNDKPEEPSLGGGGRYDNLIGMFAKRPIPAVGFSFGLDRLIEALV